MFFVRSSKKRRTVRLLAVFHAPYAEAFNKKHLIVISQFSKVFLLKNAKIKECDVIRNLKNALVTIRSHMSLQA